MSLTFDGAELADGMALEQVRAGDPAAFGVLYERHLAAARRLARSLVSSPADADDIVAEVFAATLAAIRRGRGPETDFVPYLLRSVRRECQRTWRRTGPLRSAPLDVAPDDRLSDDVDDFARTDEAKVLHDAFNALPARMRDVLWLVEVDGLSHEEIARRTRSTPQAVAQHVVRARRALSARYLQAHLSTGETPLPPECATTRRALAEHVRGTMSATRRRSITAHLESCPSCREARDHLELVNARLRGALLLSLATTAAVPRPWITGLAVRATSWIVGPTAPLVVATSLAVLGVVAPPPVFEARSPDAAAAAPGAVAVPAGAERPVRAIPSGATTDVVVDATSFGRPATSVTPDDVTDEPTTVPAPVPPADPAPAPGAAVEAGPAAPAAPTPDAPTAAEPTGSPAGARTGPDPVAPAVEPVTDTLRNVTAPILEPVTAIVAPVAPAIVEPVTTAVEPLVATVAEPVTAVVEPVTAVVEPVVAAIVEPVTTAVEPVTAIVAPVTTAVQPLAEPVTAAAAPLAAVVDVAPAIELPALGG